MVRRNASAFFPSALVFPGGTVDSDDGVDDWLDHLDNHDHLSAAERALRIAAIRETWEETRLLPCASGSLEGDPGGNFRGSISSNGVKLDLGGLVHFGHWITPPQVPKRFDTHFYLSPAPEAGEGECDGGEIVATEWAEPRILIERAAAGDRSIMFSTLMNLHRLALSRTVEEAMAAASANPPRTVMPLRVVRDDGDWVVIPPDSGYPVSEVRFHRTSST